MKSIKITINLDRALVLPIAHSALLQAIVYRFMSSSKELSEQIHEEGFVEHNRRYKLFTFSRFYGKKEVQGKQVIYHGSTRFEIRSVFDCVIDAIANSLLMEPSVVIQGNCFAVSGFSVEEEHLFPDTALIKMLTPICLHQTIDHKSVYHAPYDPLFLSLFQENFKHKYTAFYQEEPVTKVSLVPYHCTQKNKCVTKFKHIFITAWYGTFQIQGEPDYLKFLYYCGLGSKNSQGFGLFQMCP